MILSKEEDVDLGSHAWVSFDEGESGKAHAVILNSTNVLRSGTNEPDGVQITAYEGKNTGFTLPGLDPRFAFAYLNRNKFDIGADEDNKIPKDYVFEFDAEFFSTENGGFKAVDEEATIFQNLVKYQAKCSLAIPAFKISCSIPFNHVQNQARPRETLCTAALPRAPVVELAESLEELFTHVRLHARTRVADTDLDLAVHGDQLLVRVRDARRRIALPDSVAGRAIGSAKLSDGVLEVAFEAQ